MQVHLCAYLCRPVCVCVTLLKLTFKDRAYFPNSGSPFPVVLAQGKFHVEQWHPRNDQEKNVGDQKSTWKGKTIPYGKILNYFEIFN